MPAFSNADLEWALHWGQYFSSLLGRLGDLLVGNVELDEVETYLERLQPGWGYASRYFRKWPKAERYGTSSETKTLKATQIERVAQKLNPLKDRIYKGETFAILAAVALCANENLPAPSWLAIELSKALDAYTRPDGGTDLSRVFKSTLYTQKTPRKAFDARQDWELAGQLWIACWKEARANQQINSMDALIRAVLAMSNGGRPWGVRQRKARDLVVMFDRNQAELMGKREKQPLARFLSKRCKRLKPPN